MDTPTIAKYYREHDPMKRKKLLELSIENGECPQENQVRKELWDIRYAKSGKSDGAGRADGFLALWMLLEFNKEAGKRIFGARGAQKDIRKHLESLQFASLQEKGGLYEELLYRECCHLVQMYIELCKMDKSYNTTLFGIMNIGKDRSTQKIKQDIVDTAVHLPASIQMEKELSMITRAARTVYDQYFSEEEI